MSFFVAASAWCCSLMPKQRQSPRAAQQRYPSMAPKVQDTWLLPRVKMKSIDGRITSPNTAWKSRGKSTGKEVDQYTSETLRKTAWKSPRHCCGGSPKRRFPPASNQEAWPGKRGEILAWSWTVFQCAGNSRTERKLKGNDGQPWGYGKCSSIHERHRGSSLATTSAASLPYR